MDGGQGRRRSVDLRFFRPSLSFCWMAVTRIYASNPAISWRFVERVRNNSFTPRAMDPASRSEVQSSTNRLRQTSRGRSPPPPVPLSRREENLAEDDEVGAVRRSSLVIDRVARGDFKGQLQRGCPSQNRISPPTMVATIRRRRSSSGEAPAISPSRMVTSP